MASKSKYSSLSKNTLLFTVNNLGTRIISFLLIPLYTYVLSETDLGTVDLMNSTASLLVPVLTLNIQDAVLRFAIGKEYDSKSVFKNAIIINIFACFILIAGLLAVRGLGIISFADKYLLFLFAQYVLNALYNSFSMILKAEEKVSVLVVSGLLNTLTACLLNLLFLLVFKFGVDGYMAATVLGMVFACATAFFGGRLYLHLIKGKFNKDILLLMLAYSSPLIVNSMAWWINNASDKYVLTALCGVAANGLFSVAYKIPTILSTIQAVFYNAWSISAISEFDKDDRDGFIGNIYTLYSAISLIVCSAILLFNRILAAILYSKDFFAAREYVPMLLIGAMFNGLALFEGCLFTAVKNTKLVSVSTLIGAGVNLTLNIVLVITVGPFGAAVATFIGYLTVWIIRTLNLRKIVRMKVEWSRHIVSYVLIVIQSVLTVLELEWFGLICTALIIFVQKAYIVKLLKDLKKRFLK